MTRLELVQLLVSYTGGANSGPSTTIGQVGDFAKAVEYIDAAHAEIQNLHFDWDFLWATATFNTSADVDLYAGTAGLGIWDIQRIWLDDEKLYMLPWQMYRPELDYTGAEFFGVIRPDNQLQIIPVPDDTYTVTYDYFRRPKVFAANADEPYIPVQFQRVIVGRALMLYGNFEAAEESKVQGQEIYNMFLGQLERHQLTRRQQTHGRQESAPITVVCE